MRPQSSHIAATERLASNFSRYTTSRSSSEKPIARGVLADITRVVDDSGQFDELSRFDYFEIVQPDLGVIDGLPQRNSTLLAERREVRECGC